MHKNTKKAFTLVELIVVITILGILGTIAFISLQGYSKSSRDSVRISDISNIKTSLELFHLNAGKYPLPDNYEIIDFNGNTLWYQGTAGSTVINNLSRNLNKIPLDPLINKEYIYSISYTRNEYEVLSLLESELTLNNSINYVNAANIYVTPRIDGNYNGVFIKTPNNIVPIPSIMTSENIIGGMTLNDTNIKSQIITSGDNIPKYSNINYFTGGLDINLSVYTGSITKNSTDIEKENAIIAIQNAYTGSKLANESKIAFILGGNTTEELLALTETVILNSTDIMISTDTDINNNQTQETGDIYWDNVVLLTHMDGTDGSTNFFDEKGHTINQYGDTRISTTKNVFGGSSGLFGGTDGDYITINSSDDFKLGVGDFTIEFWINLASTIDSSNKIIFDFRPLSGQGYYPTLYIDSNGILKYFVNSTDVINSNENLSINTWYHVALSRSSGNTKLFINGIQKGSTYLDSNNYSVGLDGLIIGTGFYTNSFNINAFIDEIRITKTVGRYTENFSIPTESFSNQKLTLNGTNISCKDILDNNPGVLNGIYTIDPKNNGTGFNVYCDMTTTGGGWTMIVAQFEADPVTNWNEGIQLDYDPSLSTLKGFALNTSEIPNHTQFAIGKNLDPTFIDYTNYIYTTGNISKTLLDGLKTSNQYHIHRDLDGFYLGHDPEYTYRIDIPERFNTLTFDLADGNTTADYTSSFSPINGTINSRMFSFDGINLNTTSQSFAFTVWVR